MIFLMILGIILLLITFILLFRIRFDIILREKLLLYLNIYGIKIQLFPKKEKRIYSKKFRKGYPTQKACEKKKPEIPTEPTQQEKIPLGDKISAVTSLVKLLFSRFFKHLRLDVSKILVTVGGKDAAACAITYGIISQSVAYLLRFLETYLNIHKRRRGKIDVLCDFTAEEITYDIFISASINIWQILDIAISLMYNYFKGKDIFNIKKRITGGQKHNGRKQDQ